MIPDDPPRWPRLQFRCPPTLIARMDAAVARLGSTRQEFIRAAIADRLGHLEEQ